MPRWTRRTVLATAAAFLWRRATAADAPRVVALDWTLGAIAIDLGLAPVGLAEQRAYADWVRTPAIPHGVAEVGLRATPSFEALAALKPDLILVNALNEPVRNRLEAIAPVFLNTIYAEERRPLARAATTTRALGDRLGLRIAADALVARSEARIATARARLGGPWPQPLLPMIFFDDRHAGFYGAGSLYTDVLEALGLHNAFPIPTGAWGQVTRGIEVLADCPSTDLLVIAPVPSAAAREMERDGLWNRLLAAKSGRAFQLPPAWAYGDCGAAARFAELVVEALVPAGSSG